MKEIYLLTKTYELNDVVQYTNQPSTFAEDEVEAWDILSNTRKHLEAIHPDLVVLAHDAKHLHYYWMENDDEHREIIWVHQVQHSTWAW